MPSFTQSKPLEAAFAAHLEQFFNLSVDMFCIAGLDGYFKLVNPAWEATLGYTPEEMTSRPFMDFIHPDDVEPTNARYASQVEEGKDVIQFENRYRCKDGSYRWLLWNAKTASDQQLIYAVARDVTDVKRREEDLERKARELERSNEELDDFTHAVSHDLKEPLRGIEAFSGFLREDYADTLDEIGRRYLDVLQNSAVRMRNLIDDLLKMSRIGRVAPQRAPVPMDSIMQELRESLAYTISAGGVELRVQKNLRTVIGDRVRVLQVFENLVSNAVKYNDKPQGRIIEITCEERDDEFVSCVRDNGPGIAPQYQEKIFSDIPAPGPQGRTRGHGRRPGVVQEDRRSARRTDLGGIGRRRTGERLLLHDTGRPARVRGPGGNRCSTLRRCSQSISCLSKTIRTT